MRGVTVVNLVAKTANRVDMIRARVHRRERDAPHVEHATNDLSDAAKTGDDDGRSRIVNAVKRRWLLIAREPRGSCAGLFDWFVWFGFGVQILHGAFSIANN